MHAVVWWFATSDIVSLKTMQTRQCSHMLGIVKQRVRLHKTAFDNCFINSGWLTLGAHPSLIAHVPISDGKYNSKLL